MAALLREIFRGSHTYFIEMSDQRTIDWPLLGSPIPVFTVVGLYLWFVRSGGPKFMEKRQPYELDRAIQVYNIVQVVINVYLTVRAVKLFYGPTGIYSILCEPLDMVSTDENTMLMLQLFYSYFLVKLLDLLDTVFFVLRKKYNQVSFLHVYHHSIMALVIWYAMKFLPGGHGVFVGVINSFVHSIMYSYYFLTNWNKEYRKNIWWKKYLTQLQLFFAIFVHFGQLVLFQDCDYPRIPILVLMPQLLFIIILFGDFYWKAYISPKKVRKAGKEN